MTTENTFTLQGRIQARGEYVGETTSYNTSGELLDFSSEPYPHPDWTFQGHNLPEGLNPISCFAITNSHSEIEITTNFSMPRTDLKIILYRRSESTNELHIAVTFKKSLTGLPSENENYLTFTIPEDMASECNKVIIHPLQDDPKTSRGTVTTVQSHTHWGNNK